MISKLKSKLSKEFEMKDLGAAKKILGMEIHSYRKAGKLYLSQSQYLEKVFNRFNMGNYKAVSTSFAAHFRLSALVHSMRRTLRRHLMFLILVQLVV